MSDNERREPDPQRVNHVARARKRYTLCGRRRRDVPTVSMDYFVSSLLEVDRHREGDYCAECRRAAVDILPDEVVPNPNFRAVETVVAEPDPGLGWGDERRERWTRMAGEVRRMSRWSAGGDLVFATENLLLSGEWSREAALLVNETLGEGPACVGGVGADSIALVAAMIAHCPNRGYGFYVTPPQAEPASWLQMHGISSNRAVLVAGVCVTGEVLLACAEQLRSLHLCRVEKTCALLDNRRTADLMRLAGYEHRSVFRAEEGVLSAPAL